MDFPFLDFYRTGQREGWDKALVIMQFRFISIGITGIMYFAPFQHFSGLAYIADTRYKYIWYHVGFLWPVMDWSE
jgi:hypothetical protein